MRFVEQKQNTEIGAHFGVTGERVRQIIGNTQHLHPLRVDWKCPVCKKKKRVERYRLKRIKTCSKECRIKNSKFGISFKGNKKEYQRRMNELRYKDPKYREKQKKYYKDKRKNDPEWRAKKKAYLKKWYKKNKGRN